MLLIDTRVNSGVYATLVEPSNIRGALSYFQHERVRRVSKDVSFDRFLDDYIMNINKISPAEWGVVLSGKRSRTPRTFFDSNQSSVATRLKPHKPSHSEFYSESIEFVSIQSEESMGGKRLKASEKSSKLAVSSLFPSLVAVCQEMYLQETMLESCNNSLNLLSIACVCNQPTAI